MTLQPGEILHQRYRVAGLLEQGGFGAVYRAWDLSLGRSCALKENLDASGEAQEQFEREARILANLSHPHLPRVTDHFFIPGQGQYLVMDLVEGQDLQAMLDERIAPLEQNQAAAWIAQVCEALDYLHSQNPPVIHRDIKPANIRISSQGRAMLVDFGIAKIYDSKLKTTVGARAVTPGYSPYEQYGQGTTDPRSDLYALGATLYTLLSGKEPPESIQRVVRDPLVSLEKLNPLVSPALAQVVKRAMQLDPEQRFQSAAEFKAALVPKAARSRLSELLTRSWVFGALILALVLVGLVLFFFTPQTGANSELVSGTSSPSATFVSVSETPAASQAFSASPTVFVSSPTPEPAAQPWVYIVQAGDTCLALALRFDVLMREIVQLNSLEADCNQLFAGQQLLIPFTDTVATLQALSVTATLDVAGLRLSETDGMELVAVPEGVFLMGATEEEAPAEADEKPQRAIYLDTFWIDRTEVTNAMYAGCVQAGACEQPVERFSKTRLFYYGDQRFASYPVTYVSWQNAFSYCQWAGRRLPTEAEWEKAARGTDGRLYPWGSQRPDSTLANFDNRVGDTTPVGYYPAGASPYGVLDMAGNVAEWVSDWYAADYYALAPSINPPGPKTGEYRVLRGGSWFSAMRVVRSIFRTWNYPELGYDSSGFRCAANP